MIHGHVAAGYARCWLSNPCRVRGKKRKNRGWTRMDTDGEDIGGLQFGLSGS